MKKIIIPITVFSIILIIIVVIINTDNKEKESNIKNIKATTETFTLTDNGTEIEVKLENKNDSEIEIKGVEATLYDSSNKKITTLKYDKKIKIEKNKIIKITSKEKYPETVDIKIKKV